MSNNHQRGPPGPMMGAPAPFPGTQRPAGMAPSRPMMGPPRPGTAPGPAPNHPASGPPRPGAPGAPMRPLAAGPPAPAARPMGPPRPGATPAGPMPVRPGSQPSSGGSSGPPRPSAPGGPPRPGFRPPLGATGPPAPRPGGAPGMRPQMGSPPGTMGPPRPGATAPPTAGPLRPGPPGGPMQRPPGGSPTASRGPAMGPGLTGPPMGAAIGPPRPGGVRPGLQPPPTGGPPGARQMQQPPGVQAGPPTRGPPAPGPTGSSGFGPPATGPGPGQQRFGPGPPPTGGPATWQPRPGGSPSGTPMASAGMQPPGRVMGTFGGTANNSTPSAAALAEQLDSFPLGPEAPGAPDATDISLFPRPLIGDGETAPTEEQLKLPTAPFEAGSCDPRIMRPTLACAPNSMSLKQSWHIPLGIVVQPLQDFGNTVPVIDGTQPNSIMRCSSCRSYMSPFNKWLNGGRSFRCCICGTEQPVPESCYVPLGSDGRRTDFHERPELAAGSVEFIAPADYTVRPPMPPCYFFVIDVSQTAVASGAVATIAAVIKSSLDDLIARNGTTKVGFLTYDSAVHFYNLSSGLLTAQMMVVADIDDPFPPLPDEHYVTLETARGVVDSLLDALPTAFTDTTDLDTAMGSALQAAFRTVSHLGGKLLLFTASAATKGAIQTKNRETPSLYNTEREPSLRQPADAFFRSFASECVTQQITVDVYALAGQYADLFSLALLPRTTGGTLYFYPAFNAARDAAKLTHEVRHNMLRSTGWEAVMRMRCSKGMRMSTFHGHLFVRQNDLVVLPSISVDSTFVAQLTMEDSVITEEHVHVQCALLYTSPTSERRIRVHTMRLPVTSTLFSMFDHADAVGSMTTLAKLGVDKALSSRLDETRDVIQKKVISQLQEFKSVHQSHFRQGAHLAFPRTLRNLLPWTHGLLRSNAFRGAAEVSADERCALMSCLLTAPSDLIMLIAYPAVFALHQPGWGVGAGGDVTLPPTVPASTRFLDPQGAYLVDAGYISFLWLGASAPQALVRDLFGATPHSSEGGDLARLVEAPIDAQPAGPRLGDVTRALLAKRRASRMLSPLCFTVVQGSHLEGYFAVHFVEDRVPPTGMSYHDFLAQIHKSLSLR